MFAMLVTIAAALVLVLVVTLGMTFLLRAGPCSGPVPGPLDAELLLQNTVTKTASFDSTAVDRGEGFAPEGLGEAVAGVVSVTALDLTDESETYAFKLQESADNETFADIGLSVSVTAVGVKVVKGFLTKRYVRLALTAGGATPSITYKAWLKPCGIAA